MSEKQDGQDRQRMQGKNGKSMALEMAKDNDMHKNMNKNMDKHMDKHMDWTENNDSNSDTKTSGGSTSFGGLSPRVAVLAGVAAVAAIAGAAAAVGAGRLDRIETASDAPQVVAGIALFASGILAAVVCAARTRIEAQRDEIEQLSDRIALQSALDVDGEREPQPAWQRDPDFEAQFELRESER